jgi:hypothetical protein
MKPVQEVVFDTARSKRVLKRRVGSASLTVAVRREGNVEMNLDTAG